jgi:cystathionine beta-lyase/cystathionine gamma-synthase
MAKSATTKNNTPHSYNSTNKKKAGAASKGIMKAVSKKSSPKKVSPKKGSVAKKSVSPKKAAAPKTKQMWDFFEEDIKYKKYGFATKAIHCGNEPDSKYGGVAPAIDLSTTYAQPYPGKPLCFDYARCGHPTRLAFERNLASLENAKYAFALNSGCSALLTISNLLSSGDHVLCVDDVYGGTQRYLRKILSERQGVQVEFADFGNLDVVRKSMKPNTKLVWAETPTNPTLKICDIAAIAKICKEKKALLAVDNTFFTPYL